VKKKLAYAGLYAAGACAFALFASAMVDRQPWLWVFLGCAVLCVTFRLYIDVLDHRAKRDEFFE
jgi:hypothetical protein